MAKTTSTKRRATTSSAAALAAVMLAAPGPAAPAPAPVHQTNQTPAPENSGRKSADVKPAGKAKGLNFSKIKIEYKHKGEYSIAGEGQGHIVFEDRRGNLFYVDQATGDQKFVSDKVFPKVEIHRRAEANNVRIVGVDAEGKVIMSNSRGEKFYLDPATGDMIIVDTLLLEAGR